MSFSNIGRSLLLGAALLSTAFAPAARAKHYQVLHSFNGGDGSSPNGNLQFDGAGNLYGTAPEGGSFGHGAIFKLSPAGDFTLAYSFTGGSDGGEPLAGPTIDPATGDLYGTTASHGANGLGGIFKLTSAGELVVLHDFKAKPDGDQPTGALTRDGKGNLYGTTFQDGSGSSDGTVFELTADGTFKVLHGLVGGDGAEPIGRLERHGKDLYGVATIGGSGSGTIFKVTAGGAFTVLHTLTGGVGLGGGMTRDKAGNLYGTDFSGGLGYVFALGPSGTWSSLYSFTGGDDGRIPAGDMLLIGKQLYGAANTGGAAGAFGTIFKLDLQGNFTLLHDFTGPPGDGAQPSGGLVEGPDGKLYGTPIRGGGHDMGIIFAVSMK
ncbi:MAG TPA: choice-of-anchor tandem repeat GloVer-containing protein [Rhizomicrobium sp.]|nr:choice-of-anchor tandem repeat GloVer-containing protein [Rhizomicrobium sp.]